jgi:hypothetical protein
MEQILEGLMNFGRMLLAGMFALTPGTMVWLTAIGIYVLGRRVILGGRHQHLSHQDKPV